MLVIWGLFVSCILELRVSMFQVSGFSLPILVGDQSFKSVFARGSVGSPGLGMIVDRLELGACDLEFVCALYLGIFEVSGQGRRQKKQRPARTTTAASPPPCLLRQSAGTHGPCSGR